jgi:hypothetical protein
MRDVVSGARAEDVPQPSPPDIRPQDLDEGGHDRLVLHPGRAHADFTIHQLDLVAFGGKLKQIFVADDRSRHGGCLFTHCASIP